MTNNRTISASGFVFAIATFVGLMLLIEGVAVGDTTNAEAAEWLSQSAHRTRMIVGAYVMSGGAIAFIVFAASLTQRLHNARAPRLVTYVAQSAGLAFAILTLAAAIGMASGAYAVAGNAEVQPIDEGAVRISTYGFALWAIPAALAGATFVASISAGALFSEALTRWLALIGFLLAALGMFGVLFLPTLGILVWAVLVAIVALVRREAPPLGQLQPSPV